MSRAVWIFILAFIVGFIFSIQNANAKIQSLGRAGGNMWAYDDATVTDNDNITGVWVLTNNKGYNIKHDKKYSIFGVHILLDCVGHQYAIDRVVILGSQSKILHQSNIPNAKFVDPEDYTIPSRLLRVACGIAG